MALLVVDKAITHPRPDILFSLSFAQIYFLVLLKTCSKLWSMGTVEQVARVAVTSVSSHLQVLKIFEGPLPPIWIIGEGRYTMYVYNERTVYNIGKVYTGG